MGNIRKAKRLYLQKDTQIMPKTETGWTLDDSPDFTPEQMAEIKKLIDDGREDEAQKLMEKILNDKP